MLWLRWPTLPAPLPLFHQNDKQTQQDFGEKYPITSFFLFYPSWFASFLEPSWRFKGSVLVRSFWYKYQSPSHPVSWHHLVGFVKIDPPITISSDHQWMGWKKHLQETMVFPMVFPIFVVISCKPIHGYHDSKRKNPLVQGYRAVLDAFQRFPRFSRAGSTAFGSVPPAKVFIIGAAWGWGDGRDGMGWEICELFSCQVSNLLLLEG